MTYELLVEVCGPGLSPQSRSHWGFAIREPGASFGDLLHVQVIDLKSLWYQFDAREGIDLATMQAEGMAKINDLTADQRRRVVSIIRAEAAPRDGKRRCQEWVVDALVSLEVEELVPDGTAEFWSGLVGKGAGEVRRATGTNWTPLR
ncbi:uncharacterized protein BJX67DRAFT_249891 [Aspergillus lucknowensis]|uniref:Uncharacterized protein n=1 Tax=Aspergillus lucknowensis TaxID=176173 RepID=A0ABR4M1Z6_9EURO